AMAPRRGFVSGRGLRTAAVAAAVSLLSPRIASALEVEVSVHAAWPEASLPAELLEGLADVGRGQDYLRSLERALEATPLDQAAWRHAAAAAAEASLCCNGSSSYARLLSVRARHAASSAVVEAARGLERADREALEGHGALGGCPSGSPWVLLQMPGMQKEAVCGADALAGLAARITAGTGRSLDAAVTSSPQGGAPWKTPLDHVLFEDSSSQAFPEAVGYADLGNPLSAAQLLKALVGSADALQASDRPGRIVFRHGAPAAGDAAPRAVLAGYGVELLTRSADEMAKSTDGEGSPSSASELDACRIGAGLSDDERADPAELFHGLDLGAMAKRDPQSAAALCRLRGDLVEAAEAELMPWELKRLGAKAVLRAMRLANESNAAEALVALGEVAQDYPSGWSRALAAGGSADEDLAWKIMAEAEKVPSVYGLEVNGWRVPESQRGVLPILRSQAPLFRGAEVLARASFSEELAFRLLRSARPGPSAPSSFDFGDPRFSAAHRRGNAVVVYDVTTDGAAGADVFPTKVVGIGLLIDPCSRKQLRFLNDLVFKSRSAVVWLQLQSSSSTAPGKRHIAPWVQSAVQALADGKPGQKAVRLLLKRLILKGDTESREKDDDVCDVKFEDRLRTLYDKLWKKAQAQAPELKKLSLEASDEGLREVPLPVPSAVVNGKVLEPDTVMQENAVHDAYERELQAISQVAQQMRFHLNNLNAEQMANWQYGPRDFSRTSFMTTPERLTAWYPGITHGQSMSPVRHVALEPQVVRALPGGEFQVGNTLSK
ncbi:unnamed protein product, partial [Polarella glacialis]